MTEATKGVGQRDTKGDTKDFFISDSWFSSNNLAESATDIGEYMIGMVKIDTKGFFKDTIQNITNDCPGYSYLVLRSKTMIPRGRLIIAIGYKYNT